ncbi:MAG: hypothetical protein LQ341_003447 [Variospora aurantia]|nr:MAG: hypothetical protein LQ341_003447 [Variospora aurantia]
MGNSSQMNPHNSPRQSLPSTISNNHPYPILDIQSKQDSDTGLAPPASRLPPIQLPDHPVQPASSDFSSPSVGTPTSSHLAAEEQLTGPFSHSSFTLSPPAEPQSLSLNQWSHVISSSSSTSSESSSASETDVDMPPGSKNAPKGPGWVKKRFEHHGMYQNEEGVLDTYPEFKAQVTAIINPARQSQIGRLEFADFQLTIQKYKYKNEATLLDRLLPFLIKDSRLVQIPSSPTDSNPGPTTVTEDQLTEEEKDVVWEAKSFLRSGLITLVDTFFNNASLPFIHNDPELAEELAKAIKRDDHLTKPMPDRSYAVDPAYCCFPEDFRIPADVERCLQVAEEVYHIFFVVEGKQDQGSQLEAINQACRDGAALVHTARLLRERLGMADVVGADDRTFVFSATISNGLMEVWVHWAEVFAEEQHRCPKFHMTMLASKAVNDEKHFRDLKKMLHNVLDWGVGRRKDRLQPLHDRIVKYAKEQEEKAKRDLAKAKVDVAAATKAKQDAAVGAPSNKRSRNE